MLHTVNKSPFERNSLANCLRLAPEGSAILLMEDGVYAALSGCRTAAMLEDAGSRFDLYVLEPDLEARGLADMALVPGVKKTGYDGFVDLVCEHSTSQAWI